MIEFPLIFQGRYEIVRPLHSGGFANLYEARQLATGQSVAIKVMQAIRSHNPADATRRADRFQREIQLCARLHHPNIVHLIDSGHTEDGLLYAVFEFVPGQNLADVLAEEGALAPQETRHLMLQVLDALACAHEQGVIHRDLKPANIMVVPTGARRNALVLDFGIGTFASPGMDAERLTATNEIVCTPMYAAPEQLCRLSATALSDLFAWGLVFIECLTGRPVVSGMSLQELVSRQLDPEPIAIPAALVGHPLGSMLRRATIKDVAMRTVTARQLMQELEACDVEGLSREELARVPNSEASRETTPIERRPAGSAAAQPALIPKITPSSASAHGQPPPMRELHPAPLLEGERRLLAVVCCALTAAGPALEAADVDVEEIDDLLGEVHAAVAEIAQRHRGLVAGAAGERVLLCFGHPAAQENDTRHAAQAALEIAAEVHARNALLVPDRGIVLEVRMAIHCGLMPVRDGGVHIKPHGTTTQVAVGLVALADPGSILVSGEAYRLLRDRFTFETEAVSRLPGVPRPVEIHTLGQARTAAETLHRSVQTEQQQLIGRTREIDLMLQCWSQAEQGNGQCIMLMGGPGFGKSRLAHCFARLLPPEAHTLLECRCEDDRRSTALYPVIDMLDRLLEPDPGDLAAGKIERLERLLSHHGFDLAEAVPLLAALLSISIEGRYAPSAGSLRRRTERTFDTLLALLFEMAEDKRVLLMVEDLHWADPATLEWLGAVVEGLPSARILLLLTARSEFSPPWITSGMLQIQLGRLSRAEVERSILQLTQGRALPAPIVEHLIERADGVPLFVEELTRMVLESGMVIDQDGSFIQKGVPSELTIPSTLRGLFMARLDRLGRAKETAQVAAAIGREFRRDVLSAVCALGEAAVQGDLDRLVAADLVHRRRRVKDETYVFKHGLIRDAAYESLAKRTRRRVHTRIAHTLEARFPELVHKQPGVLALHHAAADQKQQAIAYAERAAELAIGRPATGAGEVEAVAHVHRAREWLASIADDHERACTELRLNNLVILALLDRRGYMAPELADAVKRSQQLSNSLGEGPLTAPTLFATFEYHHMRSHRGEARAIAERLVNMADHAHDTNQAVLSLPLLGQALWLEGKLADARHCFERLLRIYDPAVHREQAFTYGMDARTIAQSALAVVLCLMGYPDLAIAEGEATVAWAREMDHPNSLGAALLYLSLVHHQIGQREKVAALNQQLIALTHREKLWFKEYGFILRDWLEGDLGRLNPRVQSLRDSGQLCGLTYYLSLSAELEATQGRHDAAVKLLDECLELAAESGEAYYVAEIYRLKATSLSVHEACTPASEECLCRAITVAREQGARMPEVRATLELCRALLRKDRRDEARVLLHAISNSPVEHGGMHEMAEARALLQEVSD